jgi:hypothetical protein
MGDVRMQITRPGIPLAEATALAPQVREWLRSEGFADGSRRFGDWMYEGSLGDYIGRRIQVSYEGRFARGTPVCVLVGWRHYLADGGYSCVETACSACGAVSPEEAEMERVYESWWADPAVTPRVACRKCGHCEALTDRDLEDVEVIAPLAITLEAAGAADDIVDNIGERFGGRWFLSAYRL